MEKSKKQSEDRSAASARARNSRYIFGAAIAGVALAGIPSLVSHARADVVADFSFESGTAAGQPFSAATSITTTGGAQFGGFTAETGTGTAYGMHAGTSGYSDPAGNGSLHSFSSNDWTSGDYYRFLVPTTGLQNIMISYDQISSSTGPRVFDLVASSDGTNFTTIGSYSISFTQTQGTATESTWGTGLSYSGYNHSFDLSALTSLNSDANALFEIVEADTTTATGGTDRIDNVVVSGTAVPEPAELSLLTVAAAGLMFRRRSKTSEPA